MYDIITFGSATLDAFLRLDKEYCEILERNIRGESEGILLPLGAKLFLQDVQTATGGCGTNVACSLSLQGLKTAFCGAIGDDMAGSYILEDLKKYGVDSKLCLKNNSLSTALSYILSVPEKERTILIFKGASHSFAVKDIPFAKIKKTKWFYAGPLNGPALEVFEPLLRFAKENKIKVAANIGEHQIKLIKSGRQDLLKMIDILFINKEEASFLLDIPFSNEKEILLSMMGMMEQGIVVITKGKEGSLVCDGRDIFSAGAIDAPMVEKTGAGDAFASGFLAGLLQSNQIEYAIQLATANATSCIQEVGAKNGLLKKGEWGPWPRAEVKRTLLEDCF